MDAVALAASIGGSIVALAGVGATAWGIKQQRESAKELEDSRQTHQRRLASGERLYEKRSALYEDMVGLLRQWSPELLAAAPLMNTVRHWPSRRRAHTVCQAVLMPARRGSGRKLQQFNRLILSRDVFCVVEGCAPWVRDTEVLTALAFD